MKKTKQQILRLLIFLSIILSSSVLKAQVVPNIDWVKHYVYRDSVDNSASAIDADNNVYVTGYGLNTSSPPNRDLIVLKYDSLSNLVWVDIFDGGQDDAGVGIKVANGKVYVVSTSDTTISNFDILTRVYNASNGSLLMHDRYDGGSNNNDYASDIEVNKVTGDFWVLGYGMFGFDEDIILAKYNSGYTLDWGYNYNNFYDQAVGLTITSNNDAYCMANVFNGVDNDVWVFLADASGSKLWDHNLGGASMMDDIAEDIITTGSDAVFCGKISNGFDWNYFTRRIDVSGNTVWSKEYDSVGVVNYATSLVRDSIGNIGVTGIVYGSSGIEYHSILYDSTGVFLWPQANKVQTNGWGALAEPRITVDSVAHHLYVSGTKNNSTADVMVYQISPFSGATKWTQYYDGPLGGNDFGTGITVSGLGIVYLSANCENSIPGFNQTTIRISQTPIYVPVNYNLQTDTFSYSHLYYPNLGQVLDTTWSPVPDVLYHTKFTYPQQYVLQNRISFCEHIENPIKDTLSRVDMIFEGANKYSQTFAAFPEKDCYLNYFTTQTGDITNVKGSSSLLVPNIYHLIDLHITSNSMGAKYFFVVKPGGNPNNIKMMFEGSTFADTVNKELQIDSYVSSWKFKKPDIYNVKFNPSTQVITTHTVTGTNGWSIPSAGFFGFSVGTYSNTWPLVIEFDMGKQLAPLNDSLNCKWSTYNGGSGKDAPADIKSNTTNQLYITGLTSSSNYPLVPGPTPVQGANGGTNDGFIDKYNSNGSRAWFTFVGGLGLDQLNSIDIAPNGDVYAVGKTYGGLTSFTKSAATNSVTYSGGSDGFIFQVHPSGFPKQWLSYWGGSEDDDITRCKFDGNGNFFFIGETRSANIPIVGTSPQYTNTNNDGSPSYREAFISRYNTSCVNTWQTFIGSSTTGKNDKLWDLTFNPSNNDLFVVGEASGTNYPNVSNGGSTNYGGTSSQPKGVISQFNNTGQMIWSTYYAGNGSDYCLSARYHNNKLYVTGKTDALSTFPVLNSGNWYYKGNAGTTFKTDAIFLVFNSSDVIEHATFIGDQYDNEFAARIELDATGRVYLCGATICGDFPKPYLQTAGTYTAFTQGNYDCFVWALEYGDTNCVWATSFGGSADDGTNGPVGYFPMMAIDGQNNLHLTSESVSNNFPVYDGFGVPYYDPTINGSSDVTITRFRLSPINAISVKEEKKSALPGVSVFPNPTNGSLNIAIDNPIKNSYFYIYNSLGQLVKTGILKAEKTQIDVGYLTPGIYVIDVRNETYKGSTKFIKTE